MEVLAFGVQPHEKALLEAAFEGRYPLKSLPWIIDEDSVALAEGYELVSTSGNGRLTRPVLERLAQGGTKLIAQRSTGFANIDLEAAAGLGLWVTHVASSSPHSVAEFAWALAQTLNRRTHRAHLRTRESDFRLDGLLGRDVHGMTVGVVGTGRTGAAFARIARGYGAEIMAWDPHPNLELHYGPLNELLLCSDLISLHVPLTPETRHLIDAAALEELKDDAILINTASAGLIDEAALVETLRAGRLGGVGLDVYEDAAALASFPNVLITPRQAFFTRESVDVILDTTLRNIDDFHSCKVTANTLVPEEA